MPVSASSGANWLQGSQLRSARIAFLEEQLAASKQREAQKDEVIVALRERLQQYEASTLSTAQEILSLMTTEVPTCVCVTA